jgi:diketogulonate reductase-like aldo/keto reductase
MMISGLNDTVTLNNGVKMPRLGLGVWQMDEGGEVEQAVGAALKFGYRSIDTAAAYGNEVGVGKAVRESGIPREYLFITTKLWNADQGYDSTLRAFEGSLKKLGMDYVDLYLIHWPVRGKYLETWRAFETLYKEGRVRAIGVSNFHTHHLKDILDRFTVVPAVNQVELHPLLAQKELRAFCARHGIQIEAWSPLMQGRLNIPAIVDIAKKHGKTPAQVVIRWDLQQNIVTIPKSVHPDRIRSNAEVFDFELSEEDMAAIDALDSGHRFGSNPDYFSFR